MKFLNRRTGVEVISPCRLEGPDWEEITEAKETAPVKETKPEKAPAKTAPKKKTVKKGAEA